MGVAKFPLVALVLSVVVGVAASRAGLLDDLSPGDAAKVRAGQQVLVTEEVAGKPWPRVKVYQTVATTPDQTMAVFFDYNNAVSFVPNCKKSLISREINPWTFEVDYEVAVPILADEEYTALNTLTRAGGGRLSVAWEVLRATSIKASEGSFCVEAFGTGSVVRYMNFVEPSSAAAGLLKGVAISQMRDTVDALVDEVTDRKANSSADLAGQVDRMNDALAD